MRSGLAPLAAMEYPGRLIILGRAPTGEWLVGYAITGRSPSSRARRLVARGDGHLYTEPSDAAVLATGNPALLVYPAIMRCDCGLVVSNGAQTQPIFQTNCADQTSSAVHVLSTAISAPILVEGIDVTAFEPDAPNYTPRISGCVRADSAALAISRRNSDGTVDRSTFDVTDTVAGQGWLLTTYSGVNTNPLPAFAEGPVRLSLEVASARDLASAIYEALAPASGKDDLRVAVAGATPEAGTSYAITNRVDLPSA